MLRSCAQCGCHVRRPDPTCPHCGAAEAHDGRSGRTAAALLLGLVLSGCPGSDKDSDSETYAIALYGVPDTGTDADGDGWSVAAGDCDDDNGAINPEEAETPDDGVDSNCDGEDNT